MCDEKESGRDENTERPTLCKKRKSQAEHTSKFDFEIIALLEAITNCLTWHKFTQSSHHKSPITILAVNQIGLKGH